MSKLFYSAKEFLAMQQRAEAAETQLNAVAAHFGEEAKAEDFNLADAVASLGKEDDAPKAISPQVAALATKYNVEGNSDAAILTNLESKIDDFAAQVPTPVNPKAGIEKIEGAAKADYELTPFEMSARLQAEQDAKHDTPVL
jgi:hypothetical protein